MRPVLDISWNISDMACSQVFMNRTSTIARYDTVGRRNLRGCICTYCMYVVSIALA